MRNTPSNISIKNKTIPNCVLLNLVLHFVKRMVRISTVVQTPKQHVSEYGCWNIESFLYSTVLVKNVTRVLPLRSLQRESNNTKCENVTSGRLLQYLLQFP